MDQQAELRCTQVSDRRGVGVIVCGLEAKRPSRVHWPRVDGGASLSLMRYSARASALVLFLSLLPSMALMAHWPSSDSGSVGLASALVQLRETHDHNDQREEERGACHAQQPCADAFAHGVSGGSWIGESEDPWHLSGTTVQAIRASGWLYTQSAVSPDPFPPRFPVS